MSSFLAFDLGASSGRAMIGRLENGRLSLTEVHRFANGPTEKDGAIYWDYPQLCLELKNGLRKALAVEPELDGIGIDTWGVDYVFFDKGDRKDAALAVSLSRCAHGFAGDRRLEQDFETGAL